MIGGLSSVLETGAGGFVGGHVARSLAASGAYRVRGRVRRMPLMRSGAPEIDWRIGELRNPIVRNRAFKGASPPLATLAGCLDWLAKGRWLTVSRAVVAGGYLCFHVDGTRADRAFGLLHGPPKAAIRRSLADCRDQGLAPWLRDVNLTGGV